RTKIRRLQEPAKHFLPQRVPRSATYQRIRKFGQMLKKKCAAVVVEYEVSVSKAAAGRKYELRRRRSGRYCNFRSFVLKFHRNRGDPLRGSNEDFHPLGPSKRPSSLGIGLDEGETRPVDYSSYRRSSCFFDPRPAPGGHINVRMFVEDPDRVKPACMSELKLLQVRVQTGLQPAASYKSLECPLDAGT